MLVAGLRLLAEKHGADFFSEFVEHKPARKRSRTIQSPAGGAEFLFAAGAESEDPARPARWGINE
jgi:hypothetical protein